MVQTFQVDQLKKGGSDHVNHVEVSGLLVQVVKKLGQIGMLFSTRMVPVSCLTHKHVLGSINYLKALAVVEDLYRFEIATLASKDLFLFLAMKLSSRWQTKKDALGTKFITVLMMEGNITWMSLLARIALLVSTGLKMLEMMT